MKTHASEPERYVIRRYFQVDKCGELNQTLDVISSSHKQTVPRKVIEQSLGKAKESNDLLDTTTKKTSDGIELIHD